MLVLGYVKSDSPNKPVGAERRIVCSYDRSPEPGEVCDVEVAQWRNCTKENKYNYHKSAPCIFLKLNKVLLHLL